jgi:hypothetical protein
MLPGQCEEVRRSFVVDERDRYMANHEGRFRIPVLPGQGIISFMAHAHETYPRSAGADKIEGGDTQADTLMFPTSPIRCTASSFHVVDEVNPAKDYGRVVLNLTLDSGDSVVGHILGPDGKPAAKAWYSGKSADFASWGPAGPDGTFTVNDYDPAKPRSLVFFDKDRKLTAPCAVRRPTKGPDREVPTRRQRDRSARQ